MTEFIGAVDSLSELLSHGAVSKIRPFLRPLNDRASTIICKENGIKSRKALGRFKYLRKLLCKEYFRLAGWDTIAKKYANVEGRNAEMWTIFNYKKGSLAYQLFFGESLAELEAQFENYKVFE